MNKWTLNANSSEIGMNISMNCFGLCIDLNSTLSCSSETIHQVVKKSLNNNGTLTCVNGSGSLMLDRPRGIFIDKEFNLCIVDRDNNRIQ